MPCLSEAEEVVSDVDEAGRSTRRTGVARDGDIIALHDEDGEDGQHTELEIEIPVAEDAMREGRRDGGEAVEVVVEDGRRPRAVLGSEGEEGLVFAMSLFHVE